MINQVLRVRIVQDVYKLSGSWIISRREKNGILDLDNIESNTNLEYILEKRLYTISMNNNYEVALTKVFYPNVYSKYIHVDDMITKINTSNYCLLTNKEESVLRCFVNNKITG